MRNVIFVAPFFMETTLRFISAVSRQSDVRLGLISQDPAAKLEPGLRQRLAAHAQVDDAVDPVTLLPAIQQMAGELGGLDRLLGTLEELQVPLGQLRDHLGLPGLGEAAAENFRDKARMKSVLKQAGLPCARHELVTEPAAVAAAAERVGFPMVVKPPDGAGARGTFRVENAAQLAEAFRGSPPSAARPTLMEEFVQGEERSFDSVCVDGRLAWYSINHYFPSPLTVLREPWIQWCVLCPREVDQPEYRPIVEAAQAALAVLGLKTGLSHMEWFLRPDGSVAISEVGARPPGAQFTTLISYAHDFDLYAAWARLMCHDQFEPRPRPYAAGAAYLRGQGRGRVQEVHGLRDLVEELGQLVVEARLPQVGQSPTGSYEGEGFIIVRHPETEVVRDALQRIVQRVRVELA